MTVIQPRRGTASQWTTANPVLAVGEVGYETDTKLSKRGDGVTAWNALAYQNSADDLVGATTVGKNVVKAPDQAAARSAIGAEVAGASKTMNDITDASAVGKNVVKAVDASAARSVLGASTVGDSVFTAGSASAARSTLDAPQRSTFDVRAYGAVPDARTLTVSITSGSNTITTSSAFFSGWAGKTICIQGAGAAGANFVTTVTASTGSSMTLQTAASTTVAGVTAVVGTNSTTAFQTAISAMKPGCILDIPAILAAGTGDSYMITDTLTNTTANIHLRGTGGAFGANGSRLLFAPATGRVLFDHGTDSGNAYDSNEYNGPQGLHFTGLNFMAPLGDTALANTTTPGKYASGTTGVRDWRGGDKIFDHCTFQGFDTAVWSIQADFDTWNSCTVYQCNRGIYHGPRSDQLTWNAGYFGGCNLAVDLDAAIQARFFGTSFVNCGTPTTSAILLHSAGWARGSDGHLFQGCWYEQFLGDLVESFFAVGLTNGVADTTVSRDLKINDSTFAMDLLASGHNTKYMVKASAADRISIRGVSRDDALNLTAWFRITGSSNVTGYLDVNSKFDRNVNTTTAPVIVDQTGATGTNKINVVSWGSSDRNGVTVGDLTLINGFNRPAGFDTVSTGTLAINMAAQGVRFITLNSSTTLTLNNISGIGGHYIIIVRQGASGGPYTVTWPSTVKWVGGVAPTLSTTANYYDVFTFYAANSSTLLEISRAIGVR